MKSSSTRTFVLFGTLGCTLAAFACSATPSGGSTTGVGVGGSGSTDVGGGPGYNTNAGTASTIGGNGASARLPDGSLQLVGKIRDFHATFPDMEPCTNESGVKTCDSGHVEQNPTPSDSTQNCGGTKYPNSCFIGTTLGDDKKPVYVGPQTGTLTTTGPDNFKYWFNTDPSGAINLEEDLAFILADNKDGTFTYANNAYFPIDGELFDNEGNAHNFGFTTEVHMKFTYRAKQSFYFKGDDDLIVFINNQLVVDRSGIHSAQDATLNLDDLGLNPNQSYSFDLFYCERHKNQSDLLITTSMEFTETVPIN